MRAIPSTPSVVPADRDVTVYIVLDDFGELGTAYLETDEATCDQQSVIDDFLTGQFNNHLRVIALNTAEGWARDASECRSFQLSRSPSPRPSHIKATRSTCSSTFNPRMKPESSERSVILL